MAVPLRRDVKSPLAARNDDESALLDTAAKRTTRRSRRRRNRRRRRRRTPRQARRNPDEKPAEEKKTDDKPVAPPIVDIELDGFEARGDRAAAEGRQLRRIFRRSKGKLPMPAPAAHRFRRREERDRLLRLRGARRKTRAGRRGRIRGHGRRQEDARDQQAEVAPSSTSRRDRSSRNPW